MHGGPQDFGDDIPLQLSTNLNEVIFKGILKAKNFANNEKIRDGIQSSLETLLKDWDGPNVMLTMRKF